MRQNPMQDAIYKSIIGDANLSRKWLAKGPSHDNYQRFSRTRIFTNECHRALEQIDLKDKKILGVVSSGDFMIHALAKGCSEYVGVDVNLLALFFAELKVAGIKTLDYQSFLEFFCIPNENEWWYGKQSRRRPKSLPYSSDKDLRKGPFNPSAYQAVREELSDVVRGFFDGIIGKKYIEEDFLHPLPVFYLEDGKFIQDARLSIPYLSSQEEYDKAQRSIQGRAMPRLQVGNFICPDALKNHYRYGKIISVCQSAQHDRYDLHIGNMPVEGDFDVIYTSNIPTYLSMDEERDEPSRFMQQLLDSSNEIISFSLGESVDWNAYDPMLGSHVFEDPRRWAKKMEERGLRVRAYQNETNKGDHKFLTAFIVSK